MNVQSSPSRVVAFHCALCISLVTAVLTAVAAGTASWEQRNTKTIYDGIILKYEETYYGIGLVERFYERRQYLQDGTVQVYTADLKHEDCKDDSQQCKDYYETGQDVLALLVVTLILLFVAAVLMCCVQGSLLSVRPAKVVPFLFYIQFVLLLAAVVKYDQGKPDKYSVEGEELVELNYGFSFALTIVAAILALVTGLAVHPSVLRSDEQYSRI
eukprot:TRINITY_DN2284_c0_g1_i2.p1 TRINITY_DN2284_c0_g1~~TRINITY_DN2284_c0_g1_i2.p1  ORF type:complete len:214 (+),score=48.18 TRINITY_DN2284_c0_g1_i2:26-667(+)